MRHKCIHLWPIFFLKGIKPNKIWQYCLYYKMKYLNLKNKFLKNKVSNKLLLALMLTTTITVGFSAWMITTDMQGTTLSGTLNNATIQTESDFGNLNFSKRYNKSTFLSSVDTALTDSNHLDKLKTTLSWENKGNNSIFAGNLTDYFDIYDPNYPVSKDSPYLKNKETNEDIYLENHQIVEESNTSGSIVSTVHYQNNFDYIDTSNTSFDTTQIIKHMESLKCLLDPMNGNEVTYGKLSIGSSYSYLMVYYTKVQISSSSFQYRYHFFYHVVGSDTVCRMDTSYSSSATDTSTTDVTPTITINSVTRQTNKTSSTATRISYSTSINSSARNLDLNQMRFNATAGNDANYDVIDTLKETSDFSSYKSQMTTFATSYSESIKPSISNATVEIETLTQDDVAANIDNSCNPWIYVVATRCKVTPSSGDTYYRNYRYYFYYYRLQDNTLNVTSVNNTSGVISTGSSYTNTEWPLMTTRSNNSQSFNFNGTSSSSNANKSSIVPFSRYSRSSLRYSYTSKSTATSNYSGITDLMVYFDGATFFNNVDKTRTSADYDEEILIDYLKTCNSYHNSIPSGETLHFETFTDPNYPYLFFIKSYRETASNKYYYFTTNMFYYLTSLNTTNNNLMKLYQDRLATSSSSAYSSNTFEISLHTETQSSYPSKISESHELSSYLYVDVTYGTATPSKNRNFTFGNSVNSQASGYKIYSFNASHNAFEENIKDVYSLLNAYTIYYEVDETKEMRFNSYLYNDRWYFSGAYSRKNIVASTTFNNSYTFAPSLYNCIYSTTSATPSGVNTYISSTDMDSSYYLSNTSLITLSQKEIVQVKYDFSNNSGGLQSFNMQLVNLGGRAKARVQTLFSRIKGDTLTFDYHIKLRPKNETYLNNMETILNCFDFNLDIQMVNEALTR